MAARLIAPVWLIELFEANEILPPLALSVMVPVWVMPVFEPALVLFAVTDRLEPPETIVIAPRETIVDAVVPVPVIDMLLAEIAPARSTAMLALEVLLIVIEPELAVIVPVLLLFTPGLVVDAELVEVAVRLIFPVVEVSAELK